MRLKSYKISNRAVRPLYYVLACFLNLLAKIITVSVRNKRMLFLRLSLTCFYLRFWSASLIRMHLHLDVQQPHAYMTFRTIAQFLQRLTNYNK